MSYVGQTSLWRARRSLPSAARGEVWRRGELNPCFDDSHPRASADILLERTREEAERRGLFWMAPDVITFVITFPFYGHCLEANKFAIFYRVLQGPDRSAASDHYEGNRPEEGSKARR